MVSQVSRHLFWSQCSIEYSFLLKFLDWRNVVKQENILLDQNSQNAKIPRSRFRPPPHTSYRRRFARWARSNRHSTMYEEDGVFWFKVELFLCIGHFCAQYTETVQLRFGIPLWVSLTCYCVLLLYVVMKLIEKWYRIETTTIGIDWRTHHLVTLTILFLFDNTLCH